MRLRQHIEMHRSDRIAWLRAAVLGANDGIVSTASLLAGVASANAGQREILVAGIAGLVAGAMSMAAGEYVSVSSQADTEGADLAKERAELKANPELELDELAQIYTKRGVEDKLAREVAKQLMEKNAIEAHARDELGITESLSAKPLQAAIASGATFSVGAVLPLLMMYVSPISNLAIWVSSTSLVFLVALGMIAASAGGASLWKGALRVGFWGALAMGLTSLVGKIFGVSV